MFDTILDAIATFGAEMGAEPFMLLLAVVIIGGTVLILVLLPGGH